MTGRFFRGFAVAAAVTGLVFTGSLVSMSIVGPDARAEEQPGSSEPTVLRRLTELQYKNIVRDVFGPDIEIGGRFDPGMRKEGLLEVGAGQASISASSLDQYSTMARTVAAQVLGESRRASFVGCTPKAADAADAACARQFLSEAGRLLYRRPLVDSELNDLVAGANETAETLDDFYAGLQTALETMLQSPEFLFRWEVREPDPDNAGEWRLDAYSKAARLSFFIWNTTPDMELLAAADSGALHTQQGLARQVDRLLASPRLESGVRAFFFDMLGLDAMSTLVKDTTLYPKYSFKIAEDAQEQTLRTIVNVLLEEKGDYRDIFTTPKTFLTRQLGAVYEVPIKGQAGGASADGWQPYVFPEDDPRVGILAQPAFLGLHSHPGRTSPTLRGKALRENVLCQKVPDPPGNVDFNVVQDTSHPDYKTVRQRLTAHATEPMCVGCHKITDPIGLAMENFNTIGGFRVEENGMKIDTSGTIDGVEFDDAAGLAQAVHDHPAATSCVVSRMYAYGVGRAPTKGEETWLKQRAEDVFAKNDYRIVPLLRQIALAETFFDVPPPRSAKSEVKEAALQTPKQNREVTQ